MYGPRLIIFASFLLGMTAWSPAAWACSCLAGTPTQYYNEADIVFSGKVLDVKRNWADEYEVKFEVLERQKLKGSAKSIVVRTAMTRAECGYTFREGVVYVVYAFKDGDRYYTDRCSGNHKHYGKFE